MTRVVVTGLGVLAPNAHGRLNFARALRQGRSGITFQPELERLGFACQVAGVPQGIDELRDRYFDPATLVGMDRYAAVGCIAGLDAWDDAGLRRAQETSADWDTSISFGSALSGIETVGKTLVPAMDGGRVRRMGSSVPERVMGSSVGARLAGLLGAGGQVLSNSSACASGAEAIANGYWAIREGRTVRVLAGGCEGDSPYIWAGFDAMRVLSRNFNSAPTRASRPLSASAGGFVPACGAGAVVLESLESALGRGARIYAEVAGAAVNCGGQRNGGTMTAGNPEAIRRCIRMAVQSAAIAPEDIDLISGHLTATMADTFEIGNWREALGFTQRNFPMINAPKSMLGHTLGAAGAIESVAAILQMSENFVHPSLNCEDLHPDLEWCRGNIPQHAEEREIRIAAKTAFGFGDVNCCLIFRRMPPL